MADRNRRVVLHRRPAGVPEPEDFLIEETPITRAGEGQFLVRNLFLSVDPAQRGWASDTSNYSDPVPLDHVMRALAVGVVVESKVADFKEGDHVYGWFGWQDYCLAELKDVLTHFRDPQLPLSAYAGVLGINGLTAWLAFGDLGRAKDAEVVVVTTAAGAVGSIVGQLARSRGCRPVGIVGADWKAERCVSRYGYERAFNYNSEDLSDALREALPNGVDIFFDNTGGPLLDMLIRHMRVHGRVIQCGTSSVSNWSLPPVGLRNEREVLTRRLSWHGFVIFDHANRFNDAIRALIAEIKGGRLVHDEDVAGGIMQAPSALQRLYRGENHGKMLLHTDPS